MAPTAPPVQCSPALKAPSRAEPLPPSVSTSAVYGALVDALGEDGAKAFWRWLSVEFPGWARDGWARVDQARKGDCQ